MEGDKIQFIPICEIRAFGGDYAKGYFSIKADKLNELEESIKVIGIIEPLIVRADSEGIAKYELIAGRTRLTAAKRIGLEAVPCIVRELNDSEATLLYGESNRYREDITITEKAFMYRYAEEYSEKVQIGGFRRNTPEDDGEPNDRDKHRIIRLTYLEPKLRELVDSHKISIAVGSEVSYLPKDVQEKIYMELVGTQKILSQDTARRIRKIYDNDKRPFGLTLTPTDISCIINAGQKEKEERKVNIPISKQQLDRLPQEYKTTKAKCKLVAQLLEEFLEKN